MAEGGGAPMDPLTNGVNNDGAFLLHLLQNPSQPQPMNYRHVDPAVAAMGPTIPFDPVPILSSSGPSYPNMFFHHGDYPQINYHQTFNIPVPAMANDLVANQGYQLGINGGIIREDGTVNLMAYEAFKRSNQQFVPAMNQNFHASSNMALDLSQSTNQQFLLNNHHQRPDLSANQAFSNGFNGNIMPETRNQRVQNTNQGFSNGYNGDIRKVFDGMPQRQQRPIHPAQQANQFPNLDNYQGFNRSNNRNIEEMRNGMYNPRPVLKPHNSGDLGNWINERKGNSLHEENATKLHKFEISSKKSEIGFVSSNQSNASFVASSSDNNNNNNEDLLPEQITESSLVLEEKNDTVPSKKGPYNKDHRMDSSRGFNVSSQRIRIQKRQIQCRRDIDVFAPAFVSIFESLVPSNEEMAKQRRLINSLNKLICREWPHARLHLYGSCANNFGFSNSDIDMCLAIHNAKDSDKPEIILKLAKVLEDGNLEILQALTRARVPIVKMKDPETGLSCDICINNLLAVVNTKLLKDYALIDPRLRQLVFIVKHWAKSRKVNEAYQGTLSSYAYVIMCIYYMQTRRPAILPCLQAMEKTYVVNLDNKEYAFFDKVENLQGLGARNRESISKLVWGFFQYWAYHHDYASDVISIRTGSIISKHEKDWTRRVGIDRHLICIEDPFEISHDLGRVVDKFTIKILREEFERAANILQYDPNPIVALFEKYVPPNKIEFEDEFGNEFEGLNLN